MVALYVLLISWAALSLAAVAGASLLGNQRRRIRLALSIMFVFTGLTHFTGMAPDYLAMIPEPFPRALWLIYVSGVLEIAGAVGLQMPRFRRLAGAGLILLLIMMFPANVNAALNDIPFRGEAPTPLIVRLPEQLFFIAALWWSSVSSSSQLDEA